MVKIQIIDINKKEDAKILRDISLTPSERFVRMFDLIEFSIAFSVSKKVPQSKKGCDVITLKKQCR